MLGKQRREGARSGDRVKGRERRRAKYEWEEDVRDEGRERMQILRERKGQDGVRVQK